MKSNGRVEVPVSVLQTARKDFIAEKISDQQVSFFIWITNSNSFFFIIKIV
jgi:hypothetical protein